MELFDPATLADLKFRAKKQLRLRLRGLRAAHPAALLADASQRVVERVASLPQFCAASSVGLFWPMLERHELDLRPLAAVAYAAGKRIFFPYLSARPGGFETGFRELFALSELAPRGQRFSEPPESAPRAERGQIDLIVVPALAAAADGHRLGYGSGFYDATLPDFCPPARALVAIYDFQLLGELPVTEKDVACSVVVTDRRLIEL